MATTVDLKYIRQFSELGIEDVPLVGGKNASLGEMFRELGSTVVRVPDGFAVTAGAYRYFLEETGVDLTIRNLLSDLDLRNVEELRSRGQEIRNAILTAELPASLEEEILEAYARLGGLENAPIDVADF